MIIVVVWTHNLLLEHNVFIDTFLWCPEAAYGGEACRRAVEQRSLIMGTVTSASPAASSLNLLPSSTSELPKTKRTALRSNSAILELYGLLSRTTWIYGDFCIRFQVSERTLAWSSERAKPDGLFSIAPCSCSRHERRKTTGKILCAVTDCR